MTVPWGTEAGREFFIYVLVMTILLSPLWGAEITIGAVQVSELCGDPASDWDGDGEVSSRGDEWLEIINTGPDTVDLSAYYMRDALGDEPHLQFSGVLAAGETAVFWGSDAAAWQSAQGLSVSGLSLNNAGDLIQIFLGHPEAAGASLVDLAPYPDHAADDDRSMARFDDEWVLCDGLNTYGGALEPVGSGCPPTPGEGNVCAGLVGAASRSWSDIKILWR